MNKTLIINRELCRKLLTLEDCIPVMGEVLAGSARGDVKMLQRSAIFHQNGNLLALMTASISAMRTAGSKVIIFPGPEAAKNGTSQGIIPLFDTETGSLMAIVDASVITLVRTAAVSAAAAKVLAREDAHTAAVLGCGKQGVAHAEAMTKIRDIDRLLLWNRTTERAETAAASLREKLPGISIEVCADPKEAVSAADIICTTTSVRGDDPILKGEWLKPGAHINAVGTVSPMGREVDTEAVRKSRVFFDWKEAAIAAGDLSIPLKNGEISEDGFAGDVGSVIAGDLEGRRSNDDITLFKSVGISAEDIAAALVIYRKAKEQGLGIEVEF